MPCVRKSCYEQKRGMFQVRLNMTHVYSPPERSFRGEEAHEPYFPPHFNTFPSSPQLNVPDSSTVTQRWSLSKAPDRVCEGPPSLHAIPIYQGPHWLHVTYPSLHQSDRTHIARSLLSSLSSKHVAGNQLLSSMCLLSHCMQGCLCCMYRC